jgi:hypothetical protein
MKRPKERPTRPNYIKKIRYLANIGAIPRDVGIHTIDVLHDDWCAIFKGKPCNCNPTVRLKASVSDASRN